MHPLYHSSEPDAKRRRLDCDASFTTGPICEQPQEPRHLVQWPIVCPPPLPGNSVLPIPQQNNQYPLRYNPPAIPPCWDVRFPGYRNSAGPSNSTGGWSSNGLLNSNGPLNHWGTDSSSSTIYPGVTPYETQQTPAWTGPVLPQIHSWNLNVPTPPPPLWTQPVLPQDRPHDVTAISILTEYSQVAAKTSYESPQPKSEEDVSEPEKVEGEIVCFGMISNISGKVERRSSPDAPSRFSVELNAANKFSVADEPDTPGRISSEQGQMIQGLLDEASLDLYAACIIDTPSAASKSSKTFALLPCSLEITVYGPLDILGEIGSWFEDYDVYLQDPRECHMNVKYCNPQRLSSIDIDHCPMVSELVSQALGMTRLKDITAQPDLLDMLSSHVDLEEAPQPRALRSPLASHQKQALTFMLRREQGWAFHDKQPDVWETFDNDQARYFINRITGVDQIEEPPQFRGGIIADPMGLGKTLTMIALVATDLEANDSDMAMDSDDTKRNVSATLIVLPPALLDTWEEQLSEHVFEGRLQCRRHHAKNKLADIRDIERANIVLTTYHTISAEWNPGRGPQISILFSAHWKRIVLDEAHFIRNGNSRMANAICGLTAASRWAVTGTPIQNRLNDLATLFRFIRVHPYSDPKQFEKDISQLWKSGDNEEEAVKRLKRLSACLILRRPKSTINLPARHDKLCPVDFSREERAVYEKIRQQAITRIVEALQKDAETSRAGVYVNVLQQIESLRLVCNLGLHYHARHDKPWQPSQSDDDWTSIAQRTFNAQREMGPVICAQCSSALELTETLMDDASSQQSPQFSRCLKFTCGDCVQRLCQRGRTMACGHSPSCPVTQVSLGSNDLEEVPGMMYPESRGPTISMPSKVGALLADLKSLPEGTKCVVFSTWRLTLDIVEAGLDRAGIRSTRFDGKVPQKERRSVVHKFRTDPGLEVMLLTLSCGAVGLNLTVATRAYLMEPHWNPTLEEQALARVHRIGQTLEVTTVRFYMRDSFEEQVMGVQESKKQLAGLLLAPHEGGQVDDSLGGLHKLRSLL